MTTKPTTKGSYQEAEVAFKNLGSGKMESKKILSFTNKEVFNVVAGAKMDDCFSVIIEKNDKGYWEWKQIKQEVPGTVAASTTASNTTTRSTYETPEERAKKQVYIVRQSSISSALTFLGGATTGATVDEVLDLAEKFTAFVFNGRESTNIDDLFAQPNDLVE